MPTHGPTPGPRLNGAFLVIAGAVLLGTNAPAQALAPAGTSSTALGAIRLTLAAVVLAVVMLARGQRVRLGAWPLVPTLAAGVTMAGFQVTLFTATRLTGAAVGSLIALTVAPIVGSFLGFLVRGEAVGRGWALATAGAVTGCALLMLDGSSTTDAAGVAWAVGAGVCAAGGILSSKTLMDAHPPESVLSVMFGLGAVFLSPFLFTEDLAWLVQPRGLLIAAHLGLVASALAFILYLNGLKTVTVGTSLTLGLAEPLTAAAIAVAFLGERLAPQGALGAALVVASLIALALHGRTRGRRVRGAPTGARGREEHRRGGGGRNDGAERGASLPSAPLPVPPVGASHAEWVPGDAGPGPAEEQW